MTTTPTTTDPALAATRAAPVQIGADADSAADPAIRLHAALNGLAIDLYGLAGSMRRLDAARREGKAGGVNMAAIRAHIDNALGAIRAAFGALDAGGARALDAAVNSAGKGEEVMIRVRLSEAELAVVDASASVDQRDALLGEQVDALDGLKRWAEETFQRLGVALTLPREDDQAPPDEDEHAPPLTVSQAVVMKTMARFDGSRLLATNAVQDAMEGDESRSFETIRKAITRLIELRYADRPQGERSGARLTTIGRRRAAKIED